MAKILCIGSDAGLLQTRKLVLEQTGAEVHSTKFEAGLTLLEAQYFDVVVLCHTLAERDTIQICKLLERFWPASQLVLVEELAPTWLPTCNHDVTFPWRLGPLKFVQIIKGLLTNVISRRGKQAAFPLPRRAARTRALALVN